MSVSFEKPTEAALAHIAQYMRKEDAVESMLSHGLTPSQALQYSVGASTLVSVALINNVPCAAFGLAQASLITGVGAPWLLGTRLICNHSREFIEHTRVGVEQMLDVCPVLENYVHIDNLKSIRWLRSLGFTIFPPEPYGVCGKLFHRFHLEKGYV